MRHRVHLGRLFGISIGFDPSWLVIALLVAWSLAEGEFPSQMPEITPAVAWSMAIVGTLGLFGSVLLHELAHALVARRYGVGTRGITLFLFGGVAELEREPPTPAAEFVIAAAGPAASTAVAIAASVGVGVVMALGGTVPLAMAVVWISRINFLLALFNLLPAFPLDGGRMLRSLLWWWRGDLLAATRVAAGIGQGLAFGLIGLGVLRVMATGHLGAGIWLALIGLFVRNAARTAYRQTVWRELLAGEPVRRFMETDPVVVPRHISIAEMMDAHARDGRASVLPVVDDRRVVGLVSTGSAQRLPRHEWDRQSVGTVTEPCSAANTIAPGTDALAALDRMRSSGLGRLLVVEGGDLIGTVQLGDLLRGVAGRAS